MYVTFKSFTWCDLYHGKSDQKKHVFKYSIKKPQDFGVFLSNKHLVICVGPLNEWPTGQASFKKDKKNKVCLFLLVCFKNGTTKTGLRKTAS